MQTIQKYQDCKTKISPKHPIFNNKYYITSKLGEGFTSRVYLCVDIQDPSNKFALKVLKESLVANSIAQKSFMLETQILNELNHKHINKIISSGQTGQIIKPSGKVMNGITFLILEYVHGHLFLDFLKKSKALSEKGGRFLID